MSKTKMIITTLVSVLALSALASASASAAESGWMVNGALLSGSQALATTAKVDEPGKLTAAGITIECKGKTLNGAAPEITSPNKGSATDLEFTECESRSANCTISPSTIKTVPITTETTLEGASATVTTFKPKTKSTFTTIKYTGENCSLAGTNAVTGQVKVLSPEGQDERTFQLIKSITTEASAELKVASSNAGFEGAALLALSTLKPWSYL